MDSEISMIGKVAGECDCSQETAQALLDDFTYCMRESLRMNHIVAIPGFGTFAPVKTDEFIENTADGKRYLIPPSIKLEFKTSVLLRKKLLG